MCRFGSQRTQAQRSSYTFHFHYTLLRSSATSYCSCLLSEPITSSCFTIPHPYLSCLAVYSFAIIMWEMLTWQQPYEDMMSVQVSASPAPLTCGVPVLRKVQGARRTRAGPLQFANPQLKPTSNHLQLACFFVYARSRTSQLTPKTPSLIPIPPCPAGHLLRADGHRASRHPARPRAARLPRRVAAPVPPAHGALLARGCGAAAVLQGGGRVLPGGAGKPESGVGVSWRRDARPGASHLASSARIMCMLIPKWVHTRALCGKLGLDN